MRKTLAGVLAPIVVLVVAAVACSSNSSPSGSGGMTGPTGPTVNISTLAKNARVVQAVPTTVGASSIVFQDVPELQSFAVGDVMVSATRLATPYIMTITSIQRSGGKVTFQTSPASFTDLFDEVHFAQTIKMGDGPDAVSGLDALHPGELRLEGITPANVPVVKEWELGQNGDKGKIQAGGSGSIDMSESYFKLTGGVEFNLDYTLLGGVTDLKLAVQGTATANIGAKVSMTGLANYQSPSEDWYEGKVAVFWFEVGIVPVPIVLDVDFADYGQVEVEGKLTLHAATNVSVSIEEGAEYSNGAWAAINNCSVNVTKQPLTVSGADGSLTLKYVPMSAKFLLKPFDAAGPTLEFDPYLGLTGKYSTEGGEIDGTIGVDLEIGGEVEIMHHNLGSFAYMLPSYQSAPPLVLWKSPPNACAVSPDAGVANAAWCYSANLRSCATGASSTSCFTKSGTCSSVSLANGPSNEDIVCNPPKLLECLCEGSEAGEKDAGKTSSDAGDCFTQFCSPCPRGALACNVPN